MVAFAVLALSAVPAAGEPSPECGAHCLYVALRALDVPATHAELKQRLGPSVSGGHSLGRIEETARGYGVETLGVKTSVENLRRRPGRFACLAHFDGKHYVLVTAALEGEAVKIVDPPQSYELPPETLATRWDGTALLISPYPLLAEEDLPRPFPWLPTAAGAAAVACAAGLFFAVRRRRRE